MTGIIKRMSLIFSVFLLMVISTFGNSVIQITDYAAALRKELFDPKRYDRFNNPLMEDNPYVPENNSSAFTIQLSLLVLHIYDLDEFTGTLTTNNWFLAFWNDYRLQWLPEDYGNQYILHTPFDSVWLPELVLINDVEAMVMNKIADANLFIYNNGDVYWSAPVNFKTACYIDHKLYPFDEHTCKISIRVWSMHVNQYVIKNSIIDKEHEEELLIHFATDNPLWEVKSRKNEINFRTFSCCPQSPFPLFETTLTLRRRAPLFKYILITPEVLSIVLTLALFLLPPTTNAKIGIGGIVVAIQIAMLLFLGWRIPSGGKAIPAIVLFCGNTLVASILTVVISVLVIRISRTSKETPIPEWIKFLTRDPCKSILCFGTTQSQMLVRFVAKVGLANNDKEDAELIDSASIEDAEHQPNPGTGINSTTSPSDWLLIGTFIDRLCLIIYCVLTGLIIITSFA